MPLTELETGMVQEDITKGNDIVSIARRYGVSIREVRDISTALAPSAPKRVDPEWGRPELEQYTVGRCRIGSPWPVTDEIEKAKKDYDNGLVEVCSARVNTVQGPYIILYAIPRRVKITRSPYFSRDYYEC